MLELDDDTRAQLGLSQPADASFMEVNERETHQYEKEPADAVKARVYAWRAANPGWWRRDSYRTSRAAKDSRNRRERQKRQNAREVASAPRQCESDTEDPP